jgi:regulation of enolase protein 1 (concanavalin A-like superfamily)
MEWLNEPANWQRTADVLTVSVDPSTDFWRETGYGYIRDSGHVYGEVLAGDLDVSVRMRYTLGTQYDQAGVMLRADERTWLKTGVEFFEGRARLSTVLTLGRSSWMVTDLPEGTDEIVLRVSRRGDAVEVRYVIEDGPAELAALVFMPPGREVLAGVMAAAPEGPGFRVTFHDLRVTEPDWSGSAGGGNSWTGEEQPAWSAADGEPGWPAPEAGEEAPAWPATAEEEPAAWPVPAAADEGPQWQAPAGGADDPQWPVPAVQEDEPAWRAAVGQDEGPGWDPPGDDEAGWVAALAGDGDDEPAWAAAPAAAETGAQDRDGVDEPAAADPPDPAGDEPAGTGSAGTGSAEAEPAARPVRAGSSAAGIARPGPMAPGPAGPESTADEPAGQESARARTTGKEPAAQEPTDKNGGGGPPWSPAPPAGHLGWARPAIDDTAPDVDPAADWEQLAAGAQAAQAEAAGARASRWRAQADADVANEWPGPPLRTAMRSGLLAGDTGQGWAADQSVDDAQTDPGLPTPRPAAEQAGPPTPSKAGTPAPGENTAGAPPEASAASPVEAGPAAPARPDQPEPAQPAKESRRGRSRRAAADVPAEPDAADEWISLLTADPAEE